MYSIKVTVTEMVRNFSEYINRIIYKNERFILLKGKKAVVELKPIPEGFSLGKLPLVLSALPKLSHDDAEFFLKDLEEIRKSNRREKIRNPWES